MLQCKNCGYVSNDAMEFIEDEEDLDCPICGNVLKEFSQVVKKEVQPEDDYREIIAYMIKTLGNNDAWNKIEELKCTRKRIMYRKIFFSLGGVCPKSHLKQQEEE